MIGVLMFLFDFFSDQARAPPTCPVHPESGGSAPGPRAANSPLGPRRARLARPRRAAPSACAAPQTSD